MNGALLACYGAKDRSHGLLEWQGTGELPPELLGLTDRPPGSLSGDRWAPSVGCGPVGHWWALWWTEPDHKADRGGMVKSQVALWPLEQIASVPDLDGALRQLSGRSAISAAAPELLMGAVDALVSARNSPVIVPGVEFGPALISAMWPRLWSAARRSFAVRVAVSPPQGGESVAPPWLYCIPPDRVAQWPTDRLLATPSGCCNSTRAAKWFAGAPDPTMQRVLEDCQELPSDLSVLGKAARAADRVDQLAGSADAQTALWLLRTLIALAPGAGCERLKREALAALSENFRRTPSKFALSLANIKERDVPRNALPLSEVSAWASERARDLSAESAADLFVRLRPGGAERWWQETVFSDLRACLASPDPLWSATALLWMGMEASTQLLWDLLPANPMVEQSLLEAAPSVEMAEVAWRNVREVAHARRWSRLHAWAAMQSLSPRKALEAQWGFPQDAVVGLELLVKWLPGSEVVAEATEAADEPLLRLVARRTAEEPDLLMPIDASHKGWVRLWAVHIEADGCRWPPDTNRSALGSQLICAVLDGKVPDGLLKVLAEDISNTVLDHPHRTELWDKLSVTARAALLPPVARSFVARLDGTAPIDEPERWLADEVVRQARLNRPPPAVIVSILEWSIILEEKLAVDWISGARHADWAAVARRLGEAVLARRWSRAAGEIYSRCRWSTRSLCQAAIACQELLFVWQRWWLEPSHYGAYLSEADLKTLVARVGELGANLAPDRLEDIWERAGGERKRLQGNGAPDERWRDAAKLARHGALRGGLRGLAGALRDDFPHNVELQELLTILDKE